MGKKGDIRLTMVNQSPLWPGTRALVVLLAASYGFRWNLSQSAEAFTFKQRNLPHHIRYLKRGVSEAQHCNSVYMGRDVSSSSSGWKEMDTKNTLQQRLRASTRGGSELLGGDGKEGSALLLRVNFSSAEVENLRAWIRRCSFSYPLVNPRLRGECFMSENRVVCRNWRTAYSAPYWYIRLAYVREGLKHGTASDKLESGALCFSHSEAWSLRIELGQKHTTFFQHPILLEFSKIDKLKYILWAGTLSEPRSLR